MPGSNIRLISANIAIGIGKFSASASHIEIA